jgi:peptidyl-prolyl cis-trans isomerase D
MRAGMITFMRRLAGTWAAKILFVLLILSFAVWGIEDMLRGLGRDDSVARVSGQAIEAPEAQEAARRELQRISRALQGRFEPDASMRRAVAEQAVEALVMDRVLQQEAARMGVVVPDEAVRDYVFRIPGFQVEGRFSRELFNSFLRSNELTEAGFLALLRTDLARQQMSGAVRAGAALPEAAARRLLGWSLERRSVTLVELPFTEAPEPEPPTEAQLARFHENNPAQFSSPEYRDVSLVTMNAERLMAAVQVTEAEIENAYAANRDRFEVPERRRIQQVVVQEEALARTLAGQWEAAPDFAAFQATVREAGGAASELALMGQADVPIATLGDAAFAQASGTISAPIQSPFGWHVLRVVEVVPPARRELAEVRDELRAEIAAERAADLAFERANRIEDALAGRVGLAEIAQRYDLAFAEVRMNAAGLTPDGTPAALPVADAAREATIRAIFALDRNADTRLQEGDWGFMAAQVNDIIAPALLPLDQLREAVTEAYMADARRRAQDARAAALLAAVRGGQNLAAAASAAGIAAEELGPFGREPGGGNPLPRDLLAPVFELAAQGVTMVERPQSFAVVQLTGVTPADLTGQEQPIAAVRATGAQRMADDIETQYQAALRARADVRINPRMMDRVAGNTQP